MAPPTDYPDVRIFSGDASNGEAAFNPADPKRLVVGIASGTACYVKASADGGKTWGGAGPTAAIRGRKLLALCSAGRHLCGGRRPPLCGLFLHEAKSILQAAQRRGAVTVSTDQGATWSSPTSALPERGLCTDDGFGDVHLAAAPDGPRIYLAATGSDIMQRKPSFLPAPAITAQAGLPASRSRWGLPIRRAPT